MKVQKQPKNADPKKKVKQGALNFLYLLLFLGFFSFGSWQGWVWWSWVSAPVKTVTSPTSSEELALSIKIPPGSTSQQIGQSLAASGLIRSTTAWNLWTRWLTLNDRATGEDRDRVGGFKAGTYLLSPTEPMSAIADKIWRGEVVQRSYTIPEGWSLAEMAAYFESQGFFTAKDFLAVVTQVPYGQFPWLPNGLPHLEGFLYPDTYKIHGDQITPEAVVQQMLKRFEQVALPLYQKGQNPTKLSVKDWVTFASIVEKEAVVASERKLIAGVFAKRLRENMNLASDPTVEYALGIRQTVDTPLTLEQVKVSSPYNTYQNPGLPPSAIASPGLASLEASLYPENTDFLYFMARYDGTHIFSRTAAEHEAAIAQVNKQLQNKK
jgi:UPF0755 protein